MTRPCHFGWQRRGRGASHTAYSFPSNVFLRLLRRIATECQKHGRVLQTGKAQIGSKTQKHKIRGYRSCNARKHTQTAPMHSADRSIATSPQPMATEKKPLGENKCNAHGGIYESSWRRVCDNIRLCNDMFSHNAPLNSHGFVNHIGSIIFDLQCFLHLTQAVTNILQNIIRC